MNTSFLLALILAVGGSPVHLEDPLWPLEVPPVIYSDVGAPNYPVWVEADAAQIGDSLDESMFHPQVIQPIKEALSNRSAKTGECVTIAPRYQAWINPPNLSSLKSFVSESEAVLLARVVGSRTGFDRGLPSTLFSLQVVEVIKGSPIRDTYVMTVPHAELVLGSKRICSHDSRFASDPVLGGDVLIALQRQPSKDIFLDLKFPQAMISISPVNEISFPTSMEVPVGLSERDALLAFVRAAAKMTTSNEG